jgi:predicted porin
MSRAYYGLDNSNSGSDTLFFTRRAAAWIEHKDVGRLTVGRFESAGVVATIDLAGILFVASSSVSLINGKFFVRGPQGQFYSMTWGTAGLGDPAANQGRTELVRYTSPTWQGFVFDSSIGERGDYWGSMLRYANEFNGVRVAAGIGYEKIRDAQTTVTLDPASPNFVGPQPDINAWGGAVSVMHVPSGLFAQGHYMAADYSSNAAVSGYWGGTNQHKDFAFWLIQAGIAKNWFGIGNAALYGEYARLNDAAAQDFPGRNFAGSSTFAAPFTGTASQNFVTVNGVTDTELTVWGLGISQNVDAAASTIYLGYRNYSADVTCTGATTAAGQCAGAAGGTAKRLNTDDFHAVLGGMVVRF